uniref:Uncharacterized protein n=1 Tax=Setaria italica TaxID=4555 RepID=K3ZFY9_SETIT
MPKVGNQSSNTQGSRCNQAFQTRSKSNYNCGTQLYILGSP